MAQSVVVLGGGSAAEAFAASLRRLDPDAGITVVERALLGGECTFWACMPSKTLLRAPELLAAMRLAPGAADAITGALDLERIFWWRDQVVDGWEDSAHESFLSDRKVEVVRGQARVAEPGVVEVDGRPLTYDALVVATGSTPTIPPLPGLEDVEAWTTLEATSSHEVPRSLIVVGGGAAGCELAQLYRRLGADVTLAQRGERLLPRVDSEVAARVAEAFEAEGIALRLGCAVERVEAADGGVRVHLSDGTAADAERLLIAAGRMPNVESLGLETLGVRLNDKGIVVDEYLSAADRVWAIGDPTGVALFTHVSKYQGRVAAANVAGQRMPADYRAIPAVIFTDPQVAQVGTLEGDGLVSAAWPVERTSRSSTYERPKRSGFVKLVADPSAGVLVGAVAVGPEVGEWLQQATLAIRARVPVEVLRDTIQPFPTFSEAIQFAARDLPL
jgi:pyruvate/2-oxoglutarate dehydrogenase complex dihydrolipoamide dehydrogenase (E3) component